jgi:uncharacterized protein
MKNAIILHGTGSNPTSFWHPYIKQELEQRGYDVWVPALPNTDTPDLKAWLAMAQQGAFTQETVIVAHSAGCALTLSVLQNLSQPIRMAILVAGYARKIDDKEDVNNILQSSYDWEKIKKNVQELIFINSDNDPWGCDDTEGRYMFDHLGGTLIIKHGEGHMGSDAFKQPYKEFPLLVKLIE